MTLQSIPILILISVVLLMIGLNLLIFKTRSPVYKLLFKRASIYEMAETLGPNVVTFLPEGKRLEISKKLMYADQPLGLTVESFIGLQALLVVGSIVLYLLLIALGLPILIMFILLPMGFFLPLAYVNNIIEKRQKEIQRDLPNMVGLISTAVRSGVELGIAFEIVADNIPGVLGNELRRTTKEISTGTKRSRAFKSLGERTGVDGLERFLETIVTAEERGGMDISQVLDEFNNDIRTARKLDMEEKASKLSTKMLLPIFACVFLPMLLLILTPVVFIFLNEF